MSRQAENKPGIPTAQRPSRFQVIELEERIAPTGVARPGHHNCHYNPHGKLVSCGKGGGYYPYYPYYGRG